MQQSHTGRAPGEGRIQTVGCLIQAWGRRRPGDSHHGVPPGGRSRVDFAAHGAAGWIARTSPPYSRPEGSPGDSVPRGYRYHTYDPVADSLGPTLDIPAEVRPMYMRQAGALHWPLFRTSGFGFDARGRFYHHNGQGYSISVYEPDGTLSRIIRRSFEARPITDTEIDEYKRISLATFDTMLKVSDREGQRQRIEDLLDEQATFPLPPHGPVIRELLVSHDGALWVENLESVAPAELEAGNVFGGFEEVRPDGSIWDLFDPDGRFLGQVRLPPRFDPQAVRGTEVTGVMRDEMDIEYVVTLAVRSAPATARSERP